VTRRVSGIVPALAFAALAAGAALLAPAPAGADDTRPVPPGKNSEAAPETARPEPAPVPQPGQTPGTRLRKAVPLDLKTISEKAARHPGEPHLLNEYGNQLIRKGRVEEARAMYVRALRLDPRFAIGWNNLGVADAALGRLGRAAHAYRQAIRIAPDYAWAHYNLGAAYDSRGRYKKAILSYEKAYELDPTLLDVKVNPQIASNRHLPAILARWYLDRGGSVLLPVQSAYPDR